MVDSKSKSLVAYHEVGHAVCGTLTPGAFHETAIIRTAEAVRRLSRNILTSDAVQMLCTIWSTHCHAQQMLHVTLLIRNVMAVSCCSYMLMSGAVEAAGFSHLQCISSQAASCILQIFSSVYINSGCWLRLLAIHLKISSPQTAGYLFRVFLSLAAGYLFNLSHLRVLAICFMPQRAACLSHLP